MKKIIIKFIPHKEQRYDTWGDYWIDKDGDWQLRISKDQGTNDENFCVAIHELIEFALTQKRKISEPAVKKFDEAHLKHPDPGFHPQAPYGKEHHFATQIEYLVLEELSTPPPTPSPFRG